MKFQLSETIWWWIEPCSEAPFVTLGFALSIYYQQRLVSNVSVPRVTVFKILQLALNNFFSFDLTRGGFIHGFEWI